MTYPISFRRKVVEYVEEGAGKREAARLFKISPDTLHRWLCSDDLKPKVHGPRHRKLCKDALRAHVEHYPDALLRERAAHFGVDPSAIWLALRAMNIRKKKSVGI